MVQASKLQQQMYKLGYSAHGRFLHPPPHLPMDLADFLQHFQFQYQEMYPALQQHVQKAMHAQVNDLRYNLLHAAFKHRLQPAESLLGLRFAYLPNRFASLTV